MRFLTHAALCAAAVATLTQQSFAASYASGVTEAGGNVTFTLNQNADNVVVYLDGVAQPALGAQAAGPVTFARGAASAWRIEVTRNDGAGFTNQLIPNLGAAYQTHTDTVNTRFNSPRGVDVNTFTNDLSLFGRVYVSNSAAGTAAADSTANFGGALPARTTTGDGIFVLSPNLTDVLAQGNAARNGGVAFTASTNAPYRVSVGPDNQLYISDWSDAQGSVYRADPTITTTINALNGVGGVAGFVADGSKNHGSVSGAVVTGSQATGNLKIWTVDEDMQETGVGVNSQLNSVWRYDVDGGTTPYTGTPTRVASPLISFASQTADIHVARDGKLYVSQNRSNGSEAGVFILDSDGNTLWDSLGATVAANLDADPALGGRQDVLRQTQAVTVSPDGKYLAVVRIGDNVVTVVPIDAGTGLPDLTKRTTFNGFGLINQSRDIAFDAADNLYVVSSGHAALRVFSPGGTAVTSLSSDGTFTSNFTNNLPEWNVDGPGSNTTGSNWTTGSAPAGSGSYAKFGNKITANANVSLDPATTYGEVVFDNAAASYTLTGSALTIGAPAANVASQGIYASSGSHTVAAPVTYTRILNLGAGPGATLNMTGAVSGGTFGLNKVGAGTVALSSLTAGSVTVADGPLTIPTLTTGPVIANPAGTLAVAGTLTATTITATSGTVAANVINGTTMNIRGTTGKVQITPGATTASKVTALSTFTTAGTPVVTTWTGTLDLTDGKLAVDYTGATVLPAILQQINHGYAVGFWNGLGINSSFIGTPANDPKNIHAIGYAESSIKLGATGGTWFNQTLDGTAILMAYTYAGDGNLDGAINGDDFAVIDRGVAKNIAAGAAFWTDGDFNYDGTVDSNDYLVLDTTFGKLAGLFTPEFLAQREAQFGGEYVAALTAAVPEPASLSLVALAAGALAARRRRAR